jgi:hypothetical protein
MNLLKEGTTDGAGAGGGLGGLGVFPPPPSNGGGNSQESQGSQGIIYIHFFKFI